MSEIAASITLRGPIGNPHLFEVGLGKVRDGFRPDLLGLKHFGEIAEFQVIQPIADF